LLGIRKDRQFEPATLGCLDTYGHYGTISP
jgi:hypothetical protein